MSMMNTATHASAARSGTIDQLTRISSAVRSGSRPSRSRCSHAHPEGDEEEHARPDDECRAGHHPEHKERRGPVRRDLRLRGARSEQQWPCVRILLGGGDAERICHSAKRSQCVTRQHTRTREARPVHRRMSTRWTGTHLTCAASLCYGAVTRNESKETPSAAVELPERLPLKPTEPAPCNGRRIRRVELPVRRLRATRRPDLRRGSRSATCR